MSQLAEVIRADLRGHADPSRAPGMQAYMKSQLPYLGVPVPLVRRLSRAAVKAHPLPDRPAWEQVIHELWDHPSYREERYAALGVLRAPAYDRYLDAAALPLLEHLIVTGAWWDLVDETSHAVGRVVAMCRAEATPVVRGWIDSPVLWLRRSSIICQLDARADTDLTLLTDAIESNIEDREFFIRKAIGWALREYSKTDPGWVVTFVEAHPQLSGLSRREALKRLTG